MNRKKPPRLALRERGDGRQAVYVILDSGMKRVATGCGADDLDGAKKALAAYILAQDATPCEATPVAVKAAAVGKGPTYLGTVLAHYKRVHGKEVAGPQTIDIHLKHLGPFWERLTLDDMNAAKGREYYEHREAIGYKGRPVKSQTISKEIGTLNAAARLWCDEHGIGAVPRVKRKGAKSKPRQRVLERREFARMLWEARRLGFKHIIRFLLIARYTGTRLDCLLRLRWLPAIDSGHINVARGVMYRLGEGETETKKKKPACELAPKLLSFCRRWAAADAKAGLSHVIHTQGAPIADLRGHWEGTTARNPWSRMIEAAGLAVDEIDEGGKVKRSSDVTPHVMRHTFVSWSLWEGKTAFEIGGVAGMSAKMVYDNYGKHQLVAREYQRQKAERIAAAEAHRLAGIAKRKTG